MLDRKIKENEQVLMELLEQACKCVETSESSENSEVELPLEKIRKRKHK